jgi:pimeloyl-ACP methyl ester carboxylesterase
MPAVELAFEVVGDGPPVVILHGLFGAGRNWSQFAQALAGDYRVYLPDARNHGASPWAGTMSYTDMAEDVQAFIERERLQRPVLVGHSMGGKTAMALGLKEPDAIGGIAVIDIAPECYADQFSSYMSAMRGLDMAAATTRSEVRRALTDSLQGDAPIEFLMQNLRRQKDRFDWRLNLMATAMCMRELCEFPEALLRARCEGPALFVTGAESDYVRPESQAGILGLFPNAEFERVPDAGHWVHADQPEALLCRLHEWLGEIRACAS